MRSSRLSRFAGSTHYTRHLLARVAPTATPSAPTGPLKSGDAATNSSLPTTSNLSTPPSRVVTSWFTWTPSEAQEVELELAKRRKADERQKKVAGGGDKDSKDGTSSSSDSSNSSSGNNKDGKNTSSSDNGSKDNKGSTTSTKKDGAANPRDGESSSSDVKNSIADAKTAAAASSSTSSTSSSKAVDGSTTNNTNNSSTSIMRGTGELKGSPIILGLKKAEPSKSEKSSTTSSKDTSSSASPDATKAGDNKATTNKNTTAPSKGKVVDDEATQLDHAKEKALYDRAFSNVRLKSYLQDHWPSSTLTELLRKNEQILRRQRDSQLQRKQDKATAAASSSQQSSSSTTTTPTTPSATTTTPATSIVYPSDVSYFDEGILQAATTATTTTTDTATDTATQQRDETALATEVCDILEEEEEELKVELSSGLSSLGEIPLVPNSVYYRSHPKEAAAIHRSHHTPRRYQHARNEESDNGSSSLQSMPSESDKKVLSEGLEKRAMVPIPPKLIIRMMKKRALSAEQLKECRRQLEERMVAAGVQVGQQQQLQFPKNPKGITGARGSSIPSLKTIVDLELPEAAPFEWIDIQSHPAATLQEYRTSIVTLLLGLQVHETLIQSTMEAVILPQFSLVDGCHCLVLRSAVEDTTTFEMDSIQELTNRLTILVFKSTGRVVTIHRAPMQFLEDIVSVWVEEYAEGASASKLLSLLTKEAVRTYHKAISSSIVQFDGYEARLFVPQRQRATLAREIYHIKRRASVYSRTLALLQEAYTTTAASLNVQSFDAYLQDVQQDIVHVRSLSDELSDNANTVLQLLFQLSSYQLNELMRVLTMFSAFFIPLSFIASVYGMNFEDLPMIDSEWGPIFCFALMAVVSTTIATWFKIKGFW